MVFILTCFIDNDADVRNPDRLTSHSEIQKKNFHRKNLKMY